MGIGNRIKQCRELLNMTQDELAEKLGYKSRSSINKIENSARNLTQSKIKQMAEILQTTPGYLMGWDDINLSAPQQKQPPEATLDYQEKELIELFRLMDDENKQNLLSVARTFANVSVKKPIYSTTATLITEDSSLK